MTESKTNRRSEPEDLFDDIDKVKTIESKGYLELELGPVTTLPFVSILTITKDRSRFFPLAIHNWKQINYPKDKIEWVIIDDSCKQEVQKIREILPKDERIKFIHLKSILPIPDKRNYGVKRCRGEIISHMDDDDYYFGDGILAKVRILLDNPNKDCVISIPLGVYDVRTETSVIADTAGKDIPEATMTYRKSFWKKGKFASKGEFSEWYGFCNHCRDRLINLPFWFNIISLNHRSNTTGTAKSIIQGQNRKMLTSRIDNQPGRGRFTKFWNKETRKIIHSLA